MKGKQIYYSDIELAWVKDHSKMPRREMCTRFNGKFERKISHDNLKQLCLRNGWKTGRNGRYGTGSVPANKGKKMPYNANSAKTQFKKGQEPLNTKYLGHERVDKDGYVWINVDETNPHTGYKRRYVMKHRYLWVKKFGKIPKNKVLKCLDSDKSNTDPDNWKLITRAMNARLGAPHGRGYDQAPSELKPIIMAATELECKAREIASS